MLPGEKLKFVESSIRNNLYSFDLLFCFFVSTLNSLRPDSLLRPFPSHYLSDHGVDTEKNFDQLVSLFKHYLTYFVKSYSIAEIRCFISNLF